jgi:acetylornithine aminotransferase
VPFGDLSAIERAIDPGSVALMVEPIQGEAGVVVPPAGYLRGLRELADRHDLLLILDEVQTGIGRTGSWFAFQQEGITPDVVTLAKGLGGGLPIGAAIGFGPAAELFAPGHHGSTFAGNPVCAAAALAVLKTIETDRLLDHVDHLGKHLAQSNEILGHPAVSHDRGRGLLLGVVLNRPVATAAVAAARAAGYLINGPAPDVLRLAPPLILSTAQADGFAADLGHILDAATTPDTRSATDAGSAGPKD